jgi:hypothetical protein
MSNRLVITEEEKQTIKRLYESAPPPDESVLVTKKNPYKHSEYKSACRLYSKDLVDGDMFYSIPRNDEYGYYGNLTGVYKKMVRNICKDLFGKKIRLPKKDEILVIGDETSVTRDEFTAFGFKTGNESRYESWLWVFEDKRATMDDSSGNNLRTNMTYSGSFDSRNEVEVPEGFMNLVVSKILEIKKQTNDFEMDKSESTIVNIPDEYFEIRKIVRTKTDF